MLGQSRPHPPVLCVSLPYHKINWVRLGSLACIEHLTPGAMSLASTHSRLSPTLSTL